MARDSAKTWLLLSVLCCTLPVVFNGCGENKQADKQETKFEIDKVYERGPLTAHVRVSKGKITIAETVLLEFEAAVAPGYEVQMPKVDKALENFGLLDLQNMGDRLDENNNVVSSYRYRLEPFLSGAFAIPAFTFEFYDVNNPDEKKYRLDTEPIDVEVASLLGEQRAELKIADIEGVVEMPKEPSYWWVWTMCVAAVIAAVVAWLSFRRKRIRQLVRIFRPAHEIAYSRLRALVAEDLVKAGRIKEFYERISDILRHYIEHRFDLRAPERTTEEFLTELQWTEALCDCDKEHLGEFLKHCDLVKFARHSPTSEQIQRTFDLVKDFIEKTRSDERKIDVTDTIGAGQTVEVGSC
ncbi:MAG TPA: hypothetical protein VMX13_08055 [Sedimentisphaerales bacterium]|nr:hypothetical protein [Sedimentisphaerales bacterium]